MRRRGRVVQGILIGLLMVASVCEVRAQSLEGGIHQVVRRVVGVLETRGLKTVTVLKVENVTTLDAVGVDGIRQMLIDSFTRAGCYAEKGADLGLKVEVAAVNERQTPGLSLTMRLSDAFGAKLPAYDGNYFMTQESQKHSAISKKTVLGRNGKFKEPVEVQNDSVSYSFFNDEATLTAFGGNADMTPRPAGPSATGSFSQRRGSESAPPPLADVLRRPSFHLTDNSGVSLAPNSPYTLQVLVNGVPRTLRVVDGAPFVDFTQGEVYTLRFVNSSPVTVTVRFSIDGLNSFYFSKVPQTHPTNAWIVEAGQTLELSGWYKAQGDAEAFLATSFDKSARKEAGLDEEPVGGISVSVLEAVPKMRDVPHLEDSLPKIIERKSMLDEFGRRVVVNVAKPDYSKVRPTEAQAPSGVYTGRGNQVAQVEGVNRRLTPGQLIGVLTVRYRHPEQ